MQHTTGLGLKENLKQSCELIFRLRVGRVSARQQTNFLENGYEATP